MGKSEMREENQIASIITLSTNVLNTPVKRKQIVSVNKKQDPTIYCLLWGFW